MLSVRLCPFGVITRAAMCDVSFVVVRTRIAIGIVGSALVYGNTNYIC